MSQRSDTSAEMFGGQIPHVSGCSASLVIRTMTTRAPGRWCLAPADWPAAARGAHSAAGPLPSRPGARAQGYNLFARERNLWQFYKKLISLKYDPSVLPPGINPREKKACVHTDLYVNVHTSLMWTTLSVRPQRMDKHVAVP